MELAQINFFFNSDLFSPKISSKGFITMFKIKRIHTHENTHTHEYLKNYKQENIKLTEKIKSSWFIKINWIKINYIICFTTTLIFSSGCTKTRKKNEVWN